MASDLDKFDLNLLVAFEALMTEQSVTRAGRVLGITQAAMSNTLRRLRSAFNDPLFVKDGARMEPTSRALEMAESVGSALHYARQVVRMEQFDPTQTQYTFHLGMVDYAGALLLPKLLDYLTRYAPGITLHIHDIGGDDDLAPLEGGAVDLVLSRFQWVPSKIYIHRFMDMIYACLHRKGHPLINDGELTLSNFIKGRFIHYYPQGMNTTVIDEMLGELGHERRIVARMDNLTLIPGVLASSDYLAIMPHLTAEYFLTYVNSLTLSQIPLHDISPLRIAMGWHPRTDKSLPHIWLRDTVAHILSHTYMM
ncbi:LysR family transcriptional regulator [Magnetococcales bacterium HHB-1]